jgi:hypothetical protein
MEYGNPIPVVVFFWNSLAGHLHISSQEASVNSSRIKSAIDLQVIDKSVLTLVVVSEIESDRSRYLRHSGSENRRWGATGR